MDQEPSSVKKTSSGSSCSSSWKDPLPKRQDLTKLYKKVEKVSRRIFHTEKNPTFVPSAIQNSHHSTSSHEAGVSPPYPVDSTFGSGFPALPTASSSQQTIPPSYGWALNGVSSSSSAAMPLSLDIGTGDETAGSGFDHLNDYEADQSYLHVPEHEAIEKRAAQRAKLKDIERRIQNENAYLNVLLSDGTEINEFLKQNYEKGLEDEDTEALEKEIAELERKLQKLREACPGVPPPRPPPPRSHSQDSTAHCPRCHIAMSHNEYRCRSCGLPSRKIDPVEAEICCCKYCS